MLFKIIKFALVFGLPFVLYAIWAFMARRRAAAGDPPLQETPWIWLSIVGLVLAILALFVTGVVPGNPTDATYTSPRLENGVIVPAEATPNK